MQQFAKIFRQRIFPLTIHTDFSQDLWYNTPKICSYSFCYQEAGEHFINNFVSIVGKAGRIRKLTPEIVSLLIDKIIVSEEVKTESGFKRTVTIFLTHIGEIELP